MRSVVFANEMANSNQLNIAEAPGSDGTAQNSNLRLEIQWVGNRGIDHFGANESDHTASSSREDSELGRRHDWPHVGLFTLEVHQSVARHRLQGAR